MSRMWIINDKGMFRYAHQETCYEQFAAVSGLRLYHEAPRMLKNTQK